MPDCQRPLKQKPEVPHSWLLGWPSRLGAVQALPAVIRHRLLSQVLPDGHKTLRERTTQLQGHGDLSVVYRHGEGESCAVPNEPRKPRPQKAQRLQPGNLRWTLYQIGPYGKSAEEHEADHRKRGQASLHKH